MSTPTITNATPTNTNPISTIASKPTLDSTKNNCQISIPDYTTLRQQNIDKINKYYNDLLASYTTTYSDYTTNSASSKTSDVQYADLKLKPKVANYNSQMINLSQTMINNVNQDTDLIMDQKNQLQQKTSDISDMMNNIQLLKDKETEMSVLVNSRQDSLNSTKDGAEGIEFTTYIYIGINILLVLIIIGLII